MLEVRHVLALAPPAWAVLESARFEPNDVQSGTFATSQPILIVDQFLQHCQRYPRAAVLLEADQTTWSIEIMLSYALHQMDRHLCPMPLAETVSRTEAIHLYGTRSLRETDALRLATTALRHWKAHGRPP